MKTQINAQQWRIIRDLFERSLEEPADKRKAFLSAQTAPPDLISEAEKLLHHHEQAQEDFLSPPSVVIAVFEPPAALQLGERVADRFEIVRLIARGGMGEVYEALDTELNETVALKSISAAFEQDPQASSRLLRELQLARRVSHNNVCRLFDLVRHVTGDRELILISMELLRGETLEQRLKREGSLPLDEAIQVVLQLLSGLQAAHDAGVIHRDLKPSNVMLTNDRTVIMDFGVARSDKLTYSRVLTSPNHIVGTLDYMAPELIRGGPATIASDNYALGVILHELVGGQRLKAGESLAEAAAKLKHRWTRVIGRCLEADPDRRPPLSEVATEISGSRRSVMFRWMQVAIAHARRSRHSSWIAVGAILTLLSLSGLWLRLYLQGARVKPGAAVYLAEMNNATKNPDLDSTGDLLRGQVRQSTHLHLVDDAKVSRALSLIAIDGKVPGSAASAREVGLRAGAALVVFSTLVPVADSYDLMVEVDRVGSNPFVVRNQWRNNWRVSGKQQIFAAVKDAGDWIRSIAGENAASVVENDFPPEEAASSSWTALNLYRQAESLKKNGQYESAVALLQRAVEIDPDFALAHMFIGDILSGLRRQEESFEHYRRALDAAGRRRLSRWEELRLRGNYAFDTGDYAIAEGAFTELRSLYPHEFLAPHYLAAVLRQEGRLEEAVRLEREAALKAPDAPQPVVILAGLNMALGRLDEAESQVRKLRSLGAGAMSAEYDGAVRFLRDDHQGAYSQFEMLTRSTTPIRKSHGFSLLGALLSETGKYDQAAAVFLEGVSADLNAGLSAQAAQKYLALAALSLRRAELALVRNYSLQAVRMVRSAEVHRRAGTVLARAGFVVEATRLVGDLGPAWPGPFAEGARRQIRGEILLRRGNQKQALQEFEKADRIDSPLRNREYLARAYSLSGDRERALFLYEGMLRSRGLFWEYADCELPGLRTSTLLEFASLAHELGYTSRALGALEEYFKIRPLADLSLPETKAAQSLLARLRAGENSKGLIP